MRALTILLLLAAIAALGVYAFFEFRPAPPEYPLARTLTSADGKSLEATIVGKTGTVLHIERTADGTRYELPIERLSEEDRRFAGKLAEQKPPVLKKTEPEDPYVQSRKDRIAVLEKNLAQTKSSLKARDAVDGMMLRKMREDIVKITKELAELRSQIEVYQTQVKKAD